MKELVEYAKRFIGVPYVWGGDNPMTGFDCSGFVQWVLESVGADPKGDQTSQALHDILLAQGAVHLSSFKAGAIVFYGKSVHSIGHVSFCLNEYQIIEAGGGDSTTKTVSDAAKRGSCVRVRPAEARKDRVAIVLPKYPLWVTSG